MMYKMVFMSGKWYVTEISKLTAGDIENITTLVLEGNPVIIVEDYHDAAEFLKINKEDFIMV